MPSRGWLFSTTHATGVFQPWFPNRNDLLGIASTVRFMETLTIAQTARHLGISDQGIRKMVERQELFILSGTSPVKLNAEHVETVRLLRRESLLLDLARRRMTPVHLAQEVRRRLFRVEEGVNLPEHKAERQRRRLTMLPTEARQLFGVASLTAACAESGCRWCLAQGFARTLGGWAPTEFSPAFRALFDQDPCARCGPALYGAVMASLASRVHPPGTRPSAPAPPASEAERQAAREWAVRRPVTASAAPMGADDGRALVSKRRREVQARLKAANRRGDRAYAESLARSLEALTADARVVDGRAAAPRGRKRCGTPVGTPCSCHSSDRRGQQ